MAQEKYATRNGKCWIRYEEVKEKKGTWEFVFPLALTLTEISTEIEKKFNEDSDKFKVIKFKFGAKRITIDRTQLNGDRVFIKIKQQLL